MGGDLALYFGFASELGGLKVRNPNLNFDVARVPSSREGGANLSYVRFNSFAVTKSSLNPNAAFSVATILSGREASAAVSKLLNLSPARRDLLAEGAADAYSSVFYESTIRSRSWLDPNPSATNAIFKDMIESITSGRSRTGEAINRANQELSQLLGK